MSEHDAKQTRELAVFDAFASVAGLCIEERRCGKPPKPDIVARVHGRGVVGYELTEIIDEGYAQGRATSPGGVHSGWFSDTTSERLKDKFGKSYEFDGPLELVVYRDEGPLENRELWGQYLNDYLQSLDDWGCFSRLWFVDIPGREVLREVTK